MINTNDIKVRNKKNWTGKGFYLPSSPLMNPFKITNGQTREMAIQRYGAMLISAIQRRDPAIVSTLQRLEIHVQKFKTLDLVCECFPKPCHGDLIKQVLLNKMITSYWLVNQPCPTCKRPEYKIGVHGV